MTSDAIPATQDERSLSYAKAVTEALGLEMEADSDIILMGEDIGPHGGVFGATAGLHDQFGKDRVVDMPISEAGFVGMAIGAAISGKRPVVELMFMDFVLVAADQLWNQAAKIRYMSGDKLDVPLTIRTQQGVGQGTGPQHSQCFETLFAHIPGFAVALPSTPADAKGLLTAAIRMDEPTVVIEHKSLYGVKGHVPEGEHVTAFGTAAKRREGNDITLVSYSRTMQVIEAAADRLAEEGIHADVIDLRTIVPLDMETVLESAGRTGRVVVVHEAHRNFGPGAEIAARISQQAWNELRAPVVRIGGLDMPVPYAQPLEQAWLPSADQVIDAARHQLKS